jgi:DevC protein
VPHDCIKSLTRTWFAALSLGIAPLRNPTTGINRNVYVLGVSGRDNVFTNPAWEAQRHLLKAPDEVLFDSRSRPEFGAVGVLFQAGVTLSEIADRRVTIKGLFELGASFSADGTVITTDEGFARLFPQRRARLIDLGLIHLRPDADVTDVLAETADGSAARCCRHDTPAVERTGTEVLERNDTGRGPTRQAHC